MGLIMAPSSSGCRRQRGVNQRKALGTLAAHNKVNMHSVVMGDFSLFFLFPEDGKLDHDHPPSALAGDQLRANPSPQCRERLRSALEMVSGHVWQLPGLPRMKPSSAQQKSAQIFLAGMEIHPKMPLKGEMCLAGWFAM